MGRFVAAAQGLATTLAVSVGLALPLNACGAQGQSHVRKAALISVGVFPTEDLIAQTVEALDEGGESVNGLHDFKVAESMAYSGIVQLEGVYSVAENEESQETAMEMLNRAWVGATFAFIMDDYERAVEADDEVEMEYQRRRARAAYGRARWYGEQLLKRRTTGFTEAQTNIDTFKAWLNQNITDADMAEDLLWLGFAWIGRVAIDVDNPEVVASLWVGVEILRHVIELDETVENGAAHVLLGAYHARSGIAELEEGKKHFDRALEINGGKLLSTKVNYAIRYYCMKRDEKNWRRLLEEVLAADEPLPEQRLANAIAKRQARRYLGNEVWREPCAFD